MYTPQADTPWQTFFYSRHYWADPPPEIATEVGCPVILLECILVCDTSILQFATSGWQFQTRGHLMIYNA